MLGYRLLVLVVMFLLLGACRKGTAPAVTSGAGGAAVAGQGGNSGAGGSGGTVASMGGTGGVIVQPPGTWTEMTTDGPCTLEVADVSKLTLLPFTWTSCGTGCQVTPAKLLPDDVYVDASTVSARVVAGDVLIYLTSVVNTAPRRQILATRKLSDGSVLGAIRNLPPTNATLCFPPGYGMSAPHVFAIGRGGDNIFGYLEPSGQFTFLHVNQMLVAGLFENDLGWGVAYGDGTVRTAFPEDATMLTTIDQGQYQADSAVARQQLVIENIAPTGGDAVIRAWEPTVPVRTLVAQQNTDIPTVALSDTKLVWVGSHGPTRHDGLYTDAIMYWSDWPAGKTSLTITQGPTLQTMGAAEWLQTWGDYAAVFSSDASGSKAVIFVVRLSDQHLWTINPRPGMRYGKVAVVTPTEIVLTEVDDGNIKLGPYIQRLLRFDLSHLDDLSTAW
jgi:hypothetical protein